MEQLHKAEKDLEYYQEKQREYTHIKEENTLLTQNMTELAEQNYSSTKELEQLKSASKDYFLAMKQLGRMQDEKLILENNSVFLNEENEMMHRKIAGLNREVKSFNKKIQTQGNFTIILRHFIEIYQNLLVKCCNLLKSIFTFFFTFHFMIMCRF